MFLIDVFTDPMRALEKLKNLAGEVWDTVKGFFGFSDTIVKAEMSIQKAESNPMAGMNSQSIRNSRRSTRIDVGDIIIQTPATDLAGISSEVGSSLKDQIAQAVDSFDDGVLA